jgi:hypothetical protein
MWNLVSVYLETVLVSVQDSWTVFAKHTILLSDDAQVQARFIPFRDGANLAAR